MSVSSAPGAVGGMGLAMTCGMTGTTLRLERQQHQVATLRLQQAVRLLQLSSVDFTQEITTMMGRNPFLEVDDGSGEDACAASFDAPSGDVSVADADGLDGSAELAPPAETAEFFESAGSDSGDPADPGPASMAADLDDTAFGPDPSLDSPRYGNDRASAVERIESAPGLRELLTQQAGWLRLSARDHALLRALIESLDDDGYLRIGLDELALLADLEPPPDASELRAALHRVQQMEPIGVGARSLAECLLLQLGGTAQGGAADAVATADTALARHVLKQHLARLAQRDLTGLAKALGCGLDAVLRACRLIRQLDPRPGARHSTTPAQFVTPDVMVRKSRGVWRAHLNPAIAPKLRVNRLYAELFARHREAGHGELAEHLKEARWIVRNIAQRLSTIAAVAEAILRRQHGFLEFGPLAMRPLGLREIADEVGVHESTVCRVTNNKFMATPVGVFELKYFFSRALPTCAGGACSATAVRGVIAQLIAAESAARPLSDAEIARQLRRQGLSVARRTVTKYRQLLKLPAAERRRALACG